MKLNPHQLVKVAAASGVDPRTVVNYLRGATLRSTTRNVVERTLKASGHGALVRDSILERVERGESRPPVHVAPEQAPPPSGLVAHIEACLYRRDRDHAIDLLQDALPYVARALGRDAVLLNQIRTFLLQHGRSS